jgi:Predicted GTPases (dynamin-related)
VRAVLARGLELLARIPVDTGPLRQALLDLEGPFLLVVVGEFNSGKSTLVNALLGEDLLPEGPTPTTERIQLLAYGEGGEERGEGFLRLWRPHPLLRELHLVDTPGTNALLESHQVLTEGFLPRADLVLFVTSADRPLTRSEAEVLHLIRAWGKKVLLVVNKVDLLAPKDQEAVARYVAQGAREVLGAEVPLFLVSARRAKEGGDPGLEALRAHIAKTLAGRALPLKLGGALGVLSRLLQEGKVALGAQREELVKGLATCEALEDLLQRHAARVRCDFAGQVAMVAQVFREVEGRGHRFLEETVRLARLPDLLNARAFREAFQREVVQDAGVRLERAVAEALRWLARREEELLLDALAYLKEARPLPRGRSPSLPPRGGARAVQPRRGGHQAFRPGPGSRGAHPGRGSGGARLGSGPGPGPQRAPGGPDGASGGLLRGLPGPLHPAPAEGKGQEAPFPEAGGGLPCGAEGPRGGPCPGGGALPGPLPGPVRGPGPAPAGPGGPPRGPGSPRGGGLRPLAQL